MTKTITLELTPYEQQTLLNALSAESIKWLGIRSDILLGKRPNASYEGADLLYRDSKSLEKRVLCQLA